MLNPQDEAAATNLMICIMGLAEIAQQCIDYQAQQNIGKIYKTQQSLKLAKANVEKFKQEISQYQEALPNPAALINEVEATLQLIETAIALSIPPPK
ncbi:MAG: hypothetical protein JW841_08680 [Deltaproteobacteria bacterium]|nr:hypothetical protein [Deltaproteobacteria bacterium]